MGELDTGTARPPLADSGEAGPGPGSTVEPASPSAAGQQGEAADVFDSPDFNVTAFVNRMFPSGEHPPWRRACAYRSNCCSYRVHALRHLQRPR